MPFETISFATIKDKVHVVDIRSDTVTKPTQSMRNAMAVAEIGDSSIDEDPTVIKLQKKCAALLGKEEGLYLPSGTMCNIVSIMVHCDKRGVEFIAGDKSHTFLFELGAPSVLAGVQCSLLVNKPDGTFCLKEVQRKIRTEISCLQPTTSLIIVENTHNIYGGRVLPLEWLDNLAEIARRFNLPIHMDGARLLNAVVQSGISAKRYVRDVDSVFICLSKGLACPMGSVLCGSAKFIAEAKRIRKMLGGGLRQVGMLAAAGIVALDEMIDRFQIDHDHAYQIAKAIHDMDSDIFQVDLTAVQTNIILIHLNPNIISAGEFIDRLAEVKETDQVKVHIRAGTLQPHIVRFVLHWEITDEDVSKTIDKVKMVIRQVHYETKLKKTIE